jgi:non-heme Fe2+,alpha-ketoglutarate-dependent halogenase
MEVAMLWIDKLRPKPTNPAYRLFVTGAVASMMGWKKLGLPSWLLPSKKLRSINDLWTDEMRVNLVKSVGTKYPQDELCRLELPKSYEPKVKVAPKYRLSKEDIRKFYTNGYLEPFTVFSEKYMAEFRDRALEFRKKKSSLYGFPCDRDRHLEWPEMAKIITHPAIVERLAQLLGPDLLVWRSQLFHKPPAVGKRVGWHQASTYWFESAFADRVMKPANINQLFQLTVWIPADPATLQSGCMEFVRGSLTGGIRWMRLGGKIGFHAVNFYPDYKVDPKKVASVEMRPGQVLIFSERTIHGSPPNVSPRHRFALNFRVIPPDTQVYCNTKKYHKAAQMDETYDLTKWKTLLIRGKNEFNLNPCAPVKDYL